MGCDIHLIAEKYNNETKCWELVGKPERHPEFDYLVMPRPYSRRNYNLFAILADVRNGYGFAGIETGEGFNVISAPRGVPADASPEFRQWAEEWGLDGHSHSWLLVQELVDFNWDQTTKCFGVVDTIEYALWSQQEDFGNKSPASYSGGVSGPFVVHVNNEAMSNLLTEAFEHGWSPPENYDHFGRTNWDPDERLPEELRARMRNTFTRVTWTETYVSCCKHFLKETLPKLLELGNPNKVRICFFFDN